MTTGARGNSQRRSGGSPGSSALRLERLDPISQRRGTGVQASPPTSDGLSGELFPAASPCGEDLLYGAALSDGLGDASGLMLGSSDALGDGEATSGKAFAMVVRIFAIVAGFRYAG